MAVTVAIHSWPPSGLHRIRVVILTPPHFGLEIGLPLDWRTDEAIPRVHLGSSKQMAKVSWCNGTAIRNAVENIGRHTNHISTHASGACALPACCILDHQILGSQIVPLILLGFAWSAWPAVRVVQELALRNENRTVLEFVAHLVRDNSSASLRLLEDPGGSSIDVLFTGRKNTHWDTALVEARESIPAEVGARLTTVTGDDVKAPTNKPDHHRALT